MTEVVTNGAAFMQPFLQPNRLQAIGISNPDLPQIALQIEAEASREHVAAAALEVPRATDDRSSLQNDNASQSGAKSDAFRFKAPEADVPAAAPVGPSKARVELPPLQLTPAAAPAPHSAIAQPPVHAAAAASPIPAAVTPAPTTDAQTSDSDVKPDAVVTPGPLGPAEALNTLTLQNLSENIIGVAFAPTQLATTTTESDAVAQQQQKNFIFSQRKLFADTEARGKFAATEAKHVAAVTTPKAEVQAAAQVVTTAASGKFATPDTAQKLSDKAAEQDNAPFESTPGEVHLYDKVAHPDAGNRFAQDDDHKGTGDERSRSNRESLYQRAQAIAYALGSKADNPEVKKLFADLERYKASMDGGEGATPAAIVSPSVVVTA